MVWAEHVRPEVWPDVRLSPDGRFVLVEARDQLRWRNEADPVTGLLRRGVLVVDGDLYVEPWYRQQIGRQAGIDAPPPQLPELLSLLSAERPLYASANRIDLARRYQLAPEGPIWRLAEQGQHP